jgi:hypothetical protein
MKESTVSFIWSKSTSMSIAADRLIRLKYSPSAGKYPNPARRRRCAIAGSTAMPDAPETAIQMIRHLQYREQNNRPVESTSVRKAS